MNKSLTAILIFFISNSVFGQNDNVENLMTKRLLSCQDIYYNATFLIPEYYEKASYDTLESIINYWENHCGISEPLLRCRIILSIENNSFNEDLYNSSILDYLQNYKQNVTYANANNENQFIYYNWNYAHHDKNLDTFSIMLSKKLLQKDNLTQIEQFFLKIYSNDFDNTFGMLKTEDFNGTKLQKYYYQKVNKYKKAVTGHGDIIAGAWIPQDNLEIVGSHPLLGFRGGIHYRKFIIDASIGFKFGKSPNIYTVYENDSLWETNHFFGGYIGLDLGYEILSFRNCSLDLIGGIAYDGFDALKVDDPDSNEDITKSLGSLNLNVGLGYKYYINHWNYLGIDFKYNFVDYKNPHGTDLTGNALTINLIYGFFGNRYNDNRLRELE